MTTTTGDSGEKILAALHTLGRATARDIANATGLAYSTTTAKLRALHSTGRVQRHVDDQGRTHRQPNPADAPHTPAGTPTTGGNRKPRRDASAAANTNREGGNVTAKTAPDRDPSGPPHTSRKPASGSQASPGNPPATSTTGPRPARNSKDTNRPTAATPATTGQGGEHEKRPRRAKGELRAAVLAVLQDHPDQTFKVSQVARHLPDASSGAIANALDKLVADGNARQVVDKPATYQAK